MAIEPIVYGAYFNRAATYDVIIANSSASIRNYVTISYWGLFIH